MRHDSRPRRSMAGPLHQSDPDPLGRAERSGPPSRAARSPTPPRAHPGSGADLTETPRRSSAESPTRGRARPRGDGPRPRSRSLRLSVPARLRLLPDDDDFLTVHLDGAPVGRRLALRLGGAILAPLPQLLLQVLEHPLPPAGPGLDRPVIDSRPASY